MKPLIGVTGRRVAAGLVTGVSERFRQRPVEVFFADFGRRVTEAGGLAVDLPFESGEAGVVSRLDGLIVTGGQDVHPARWGGRAPLDTTTDPRWQPNAPDAARDDYEVALLEAALGSGIPILGVCRGHQLLNVVLGGTLIEHLDAGAILHDSARAAPSAGDLSHLVEFLPGSLAHRVHGRSRITNSWHHQAVAGLGGGVVASGHTADGVVEAIEVAGRPVLGVQWHPEWMPGVEPAFGWLVAEASASGARR
ncbi:gamma-glutamyl-gamma-aminobutyrate hydrolase family protein [Amycolatopsis rhabdoformis]|uniref:Gamma-glutamyl-gamma-aminobutyrate hydrolase family protein n=1 Tax=Amycolatopsis rhabdoformis TaxID=1448059 RepID=A0ABZ1IEN4_9PSEU|nr:gamma-glutamyl-gamma-aminobutyrate hydrolase family protein [Amycolatopsis rhabdoformis]WSE32201.1 gamma-glutamyl-gamma-aminobutyrate hydrolase family protein [Amycolatopsis rhabdoformis]